MEQQLLILPFDHRSSFSKDLLGYTGKLTKKQHAEVVALKRVVFDAFVKVVSKEKTHGDFGILLDEEYGSAMLREAKKLGVRTCLTTEKSGQQEYQFEYGAEFAKHLDTFAPTYAKALVRYNPANTALNKRQLVRLKQLADTCHAKGYELLFELLVPATEKDLAQYKTQENYDKKRRFELTLEAITEIQKKVDVDIWKLEGFTKPQWGKIVKTVKPTSRVIVLGRGADRKQVEQWLKDGAAYEHITGFAVGRTIFEQPLKQFIAKKKTRDQAVDMIAKNFRSFVTLWRNAKKKV